MAGCVVMGMGRRCCFFAPPPSDSSGGRGEGGGSPKRRLESIGSGHLTLTSGNLASPSTPITLERGGRASFLSWELVDAS